MLNKTMRGKRAARCALLVAAFIGAGLYASAGRADSVQITSPPGSPYVDVQNGDGTWRIYLTCTDQNGAGPGYISYARLNSGQVLLDDSGTSMQDLKPGTDFTRIAIAQGLGKFVVRTARANLNDSAGLSFTDNDLSSTGNTYFLDGRHCGGVAPSHQPNYTNRSNGLDYDPGVNPDPTLTKAIPNPDGSASPSVNANGVAEVSAQVTFQDPVTPDFIRVTYVWQFHDRYIQMWSDVVERCGGPVVSNGKVIAPGTCGSGSDPKHPRYAWVKGPKFVAGVGSASSGGQYGTPYTSLTFLDKAGHTVCTPELNSNAGLTCSGKNTYANGGVNYSGYDRAWLQFAPSGGCGATPCFNSVFRAYMPAGNGSYDTSTYPAGIAPPTSASQNTTKNWQGNPNDPYNAEYYGMDQWAQNEANGFEPAEGSATGSMCTAQTGPAVLDSRAWEALGDKGYGFTGDTSPTFNFAGGYFFAWRDCVSNEDAPTLFRGMEGGDTNYGTYATFSFTNDSSIPPLINGF